MEDSIKKPLCGGQNQVLYAAQYGGEKKTPQNKMYHGRFTWPFFTD